MATSVKPIYKVQVPNNLWSHHHPRTHSSESLAVWDTSFVFLCSNITFSCSCASNTPTRGTVTFLALVPPRRQRCIQNDHMVRSPRIEATQICLQTNKSVCTPTPLRRHNTLVFAFLSQIELAHMKIMQVSSLSVFLSACGGHIEATSNMLSHRILLVLTIC